MQDRGISLLLGKVGRSFTKLLSGIIFLIAMGSCAPTAPSQAPITPVPQMAASAPAKLTAPDIKKTSTPLVRIFPPSAVEEPQRPVTESPRHPLQTQTKNAGGISFTIVSFDRRDHELRLADQASPGSTWNTSKEAAGSGLAAINAGFFTPEGKPLGLLVSGGTQKGSLNRASSLGSGFFIGGQAQLISRDSYRSNPPSEKEILQSGPRLLWNGGILPGLSDDEKRPRSFLMWDGKNHFAIVHADSASLAGLGRALKDQPFSNFKIHRALNLDGGRSSDLWVSNLVRGGALTRRSWINKPVRNYLVIHKK